MSGAAYFIEAEWRRLLELWLKAIMRDWEMQFDYGR